MLSIGLIKNAGAAASYFEKDDYYTRGEDETADAVRGVWTGKAAQALGLSGAVDRDTFQKLLSGELPDGQKLGRMRDGEREHTPGWDLTFSAPKSVSVAALVGGDRRLLDAHDQAVREAHAWMEKQATYRQRGFLGGIRIENSGALVSALFRHETSREQDPQLHTHAPTANVTVREDGKLVSLHSKSLYETKMAGGAVYRAALAQRAQQLGYELGEVAKDGAWELAGMPVEVLEHFSQRRQQIESALEQRGGGDAADAAKAALATRATKTDMDPEKLAGDWAARANSLDFDLAAFVAEARARGDTTPRIPFSAASAIGDAIDRLAQPEHVFNESDIVRWSLVASMGRAGASDIEAGIGRAAEERDLTRTELRGRAAYSTARGAESERRYLDSLERGKNAVAAPMRPAAAARALAGTTLDPGQRRAVENILTSKDRYLGIIGRPGAGKTYMMRVARQTLAQAGFTVRGMAQNSGVARNLATETGLVASTVDKHLNAMNRELIKLGDPGQRDQVLAKYRKDVWIVDEASQLGSSHMRRLTYMADRLGARVVLMGDPAQLAAIDAGKPMSLMLDAGLQKSELTEIRRQTDAGQRAAVYDAIAGRHADAIGRLSGNTTHIEDREARLAAIVAAWALNSDRDDTLMLTPNNLDKTILNNEARKVLRSEGRLGGEVQLQILGSVSMLNADQRRADSYKPGDIIKFGRGAASHDLARGEYMRVVAVDRVTNQVTLERVRDDERPEHQDKKPDSSERVRWNPRAVAGGARNGLTTYRQREAGLAPGEVIRWTANSPELGLANGEALHVIGINRQTLTLRRDDGTHITVDAGKLNAQHWDHSYASTVYRSQGVTKSKTFVNADSRSGELMNQKAFVVAISRQKDDIRIFTDDPEKFAQTVQAHTGDKTSHKDAETGRRQNQYSRMLEKLAANWNHNEKTHGAAAARMDRAAEHDR